MDLHMSHYTNKILHNEPKVLEDDSHNIEYLSSVEACTPLMFGRNLSLVGGI